MFGEIRATLGANGDPLVCALDVAKALGYKNPAKAVTQHCKGVTVLETPTSGGVQPIKFITEPNVYRLPLGLRKNTNKARLISAKITNNK